MHCGSQAPFGAGPRCLTTPARRAAMFNATLCVSVIHNEPGNQVTPVARHPPTPGIPLRFGKQSLISPSGFPSSAYCCPTRRPRGTRARGLVPENAKFKCWKEYKRNDLSCLSPPPLLASSILLVDLSRNARCVFAPSLRRGGRRTSNCRTLRPVWRHQLLGTQRVRLWIRLHDLQVGTTISTIAIHEEKC